MRKLTASLDLPVIAFGHTYLSWEQFIDFIPKNTRNLAAVVGLNSQKFRSIDSFIGAIFVIVLIFLGDLVTTLMVVGSIIAIDIGMQQFN